MLSGKKEYVSKNSVWAFHLYDDTHIEIVKLAGQSSLKCNWWEQGSTFVIVVSYIRWFKTIVLYSHIAYILYRYIALFMFSESIRKLFSINFVNICLFSIFFFNRFCPVAKASLNWLCQDLPFLCIFPKILPAGKKWRYLRSDIYAKCLFLHATTGCDTTFSINREGKATVFKKRLWNKHLQRAALVHKSHVELKSAREKKQCLLFPRATSTVPSIPFATNNLFRKQLKQNLSSSWKQYLQPNQL